MSWCRAPTIELGVTLRCTQAEKGVQKLLRVMYIGCREQSRAEQSRVEASVECTPEYCGRNGNVPQNPSPVVGLGKKMACDYHRLRL